MRLKNFNTAFLVVAITIGLFSCDKQPVGPEAPDPLGPPDPAIFMTLAEFRNNFVASSGSDVTIPAGTKKIRAMVISSSINEASSNYRLQDESGTGLYFYAKQGTPTFAMGEVLEIDPNGGAVILYNGDQELKDVPVDNVVPLSGTITVNTRTATIADINTNRLAWASSLVKISNVTSITQASSNTTGVTYNVTDATGTLSMFVRVVSGITVNLTGTSVTGYVSIYNSTTQVGIRTAADIQ